MLKAVKTIDNRTANRRSISTLMRAITCQTRDVIDIRLLINLLKVI